jgi:hypothetical protein
MENRKMNGIEPKLEMMKREIDALQIAVTSSTRPWYRNVSLWVSIIALLFSFGTTFVSYRRAENQDVQSTRQELRGLLQRLAALPRENVENSKKYSADPAAMAAIGGFINQENALLARQAAELAKRLPQTAISAAEYYSVAVALQSAYDLAAAAEFLDLIPDQTNDFNTEIAALRMKANLHFVQGRPESGRVEFQKALDIFSKYPAFDVFTKVSTTVWTELAWANAEASYYGPQSTASQHIDSAERLLASIPSSPGATALASQVAQAKEVFTQAKPNTVPLVGPPLGIAPPPQ